jgi:hypothetical protein
LLLESTEHAGNPGDERAKAVPLRAERCTWTVDGLVVRQDDKKGFVIPVDAYLWVRRDDQEQSGTDDDEDADDGGMANGSPGDGGASSGAILDTPNGAFINGGDVESVGINGVVEEAKQAD